MRRVLLQLVAVRNQLVLFPPVSRSRSQGLSKLIPSKLHQPLPLRYKYCADIHCLIGASHSLHLHHLHVGRRTWTACRHYTGCTARQSVCYQVFVSFASLCCANDDNSIWIICRNNAPSQKPKKQGQDGTQGQKVISMSICT